MFLAWEAVLERDVEKDAVAEIFLSVAARQNEADARGERGQLVHAKECLPAVVQQHVVDIAEGLAARPDRTERDRVAELMRLAEQRPLLRKANIPGAVIRAADPLYGVGRREDVLHRQALDCRLPRSETSYLFRVHMMPRTGAAAAIPAAVFAACSRAGIRSGLFRVVTVALSRAAAVAAL